ncbi:MAG: hypothetical protein HZA49_07260 [Planctomycetes bacterium]|nr:hypothetical protein [Planctomycetota bacterium]
MRQTLKLKLGLGLILAVGLIAGYYGCGGGGGSSSGSSGSGATLLDITFGGDGVVTHNNAAGGNSGDYAYSVVMSGTQIVAAGYSRNASGNDDMALWRYNADGTLDTTFGTGGVVTHNNAAGGNGNDYAYSVVMSGTQIVAAGYSSNGTNYDMTVWRYNADGTLDTAFDGDGVVTHTGAAGGTGDDKAYSVAIDASGKIVVAGSSKGAFTQDLALWRYNADGTLDTTFSGDGVVTAGSPAGGNGNDSAYSVVISGTQIVVAGVSDSLSNADMVILLYNANGTLDTTFGTNGIVTHNNAAGGNSSDGASSIVIDGNSRMVVAGYSMNASSNYDMVLWRYNADGTLDTAFGGGDGIVTHNNAAGGNGDDIGYSVVMSGTQIVVAGSSEKTPSNADMALWRYNADGTLDTTFNSQGWATHNNAAGGNFYDSGSSIVIDGNSRMVVAGYSINASSNYDMVIWRYR